MMRLDDYREVAPRGTVDLVLRLAERVRARRLVFVSATRFGGGAAEIPQRIIPILSDLGVEASWEVIGGDAEFFATSKALCAALQGEDRVITDEMLDHYLETNRLSAEKLRLEGDVIVVHDPQPGSLVEHRTGDGKWVWRCHIDLSSPQRRIWNFFRPHLARYDAAVFSLPAYAQRLTIPQYIVYPSIDPLSDRNRQLSRPEVHAIIERLGLPQDKPILLQVGQLDRHRDPVGTINSYRIVKKHHDVRLVFAGGGPTERPDDRDALSEVREAAARDPDIVVLNLPPEAHVQINALQRAAAIVVQKSVRDGFGLEVAEAMWKGKPVVGGARGGVAVQIMSDITGYAVDSVEGAGFRLRQLLTNPEQMARMGGMAREHVRRNFLITRHLADYLALVAHLTA